MIFDPPNVMFGANQTTQGNRKNAVRNAETTEQLVWNMATCALHEAVNISAEELPHGVDGSERAGLGKLPCRLVRPARVKGSPIRFECEYLNTVRIPHRSPMGPFDVVFGRLIAIQIDDNTIDAQGLIDVRKIQPLARMGFCDHTYVDNKLQAVISGNSKALMAGLKGSPDKATLEAAPH